MDGKELSVEFFQNRTRILSTVILLMFIVAVGCGGESGEPKDKPAVALVATEVVPTPDATPNLAVESATQIILQSFWQAMIQDAYGVASALFMDVYRGERQWVQADELALFDARAPELFSAEPTFTLTNSSAPKPMIYLGGDLVQSHGTLQIDGRTIPLVVEIHQTNDDVRLSRLHIGDSRLYPMPRSLAAGEFQVIEREPVDFSDADSLTLPVESSIFLERVRGALFFDAFPWESEFACEDATYFVGDVMDVIGWNHAARVESYFFTLADDQSVEQMQLKGTFEPLDNVAAVRHFEAVLNVTDVGWCLQDVLVDHNPDWALRGFFWRYGDALSGGDLTAMEPFWCEGYRDQMEPPTDVIARYAFEPVQIVDGVAQVGGSRSDVGLFSAEMQYTNGTWCFNKFVITDPSQ